MSGIQTHTQDPITPAGASGITPHIPSSASTLQPAATIAASSNGNPAAQPAAAVPTPTRAAASTSNYEPPPPQPGGAPIHQPPTTTAIATLPPPPKAGEKPMPLEYYTPAKAKTSAWFSYSPQQRYPPQMSQPPPDLSLRVMPPAPSTRTSAASAFPYSATPPSLPASTEPGRRNSLEHPPGYVQNPYASDMIPEQHFARQQQAQVDQFGASTALGYNESRKTSNAESGEEENTWDVTKRWAKEKGEKASELHGQIWERINGGK